MFKVSPPLEILARSFTPKKTLPMPPCFGVLVVVLPVYNAILRAANVCVLMRRALMLSKYVQNKVAAPHPAWWYAKRRRRRAGIWFAGVSCVR